MKTYNTVYFLLFVLLIMGAFASMAQNSYGLKLLGVVGICFALLFLYQLARYLTRPGKKDMLLQVELLSLVVLSTVFSLGFFNIHSQVTDILFFAAGLALIAVYSSKMVTSYSLLRKSDSLMALLIAMYYLSIIAFIVFILTSSLSPWVSAVAGIAGFIMLIVFLGIALVKGEFLVEGNKLNVFQWIIGVKDSSGLVISLFSAVALYFALNTAGILPPLYVDDLPQVYYKMVKTGDDGLDNAGTTRHDEFRKEYNRFISRNQLGRR
jgi:hypothetical protein